MENPQKTCMHGRKAGWLGVSGWRSVYIRRIYAAVASSSVASLRSSAASATAASSSAISFFTDPPSSTEAVALVSPWPLVWAVDVEAAGAASSASRRSTSFLALAMFYRFN